MLKTAINIDDLAPFQDFSYDRKYKKQDGTEVVDTIRGKLKGVRTVTGSDATPSYSDEWTRIVKVEGCDYRVSKEMILQWLGLYGEVLSDLVEDVFDDSEDSEADNTTGIYSVKMKMRCNIPQLLPIHGRRIKIYYRNINKLCTACFGHHNRRDCKEEKVKWIDYVEDFVNSNTHIDQEMFGKWIMILERERKQKEIFTAHFDSKQPGRNAMERDEDETSGENKTTEGHTPKNPGVEAGRSPSQSSGQQTQVTETVAQSEEPRPEDFSLPANRDEWDGLVDKLIQLGLTSKEANANIEKRKRQFNLALRVFNTGGKTSIRKGKPKKNRVKDVKN